MLNSKSNCVFWAFPEFFSSIKYDLARSCFQLWPIIGDEGDKISKNGEAIAETVIYRNFVISGADYEGDN